LVVSCGFPMGVFVLCKKWNRETDKYVAPDLPQEYWSD
jgi:hypothetical protein